MVNGAEFITDRPAQKLRIIVVFSHAVMQVYHRNVVCLTDYTLNYFNKITCDDNENERTSVYAGR
ncbi:hypothetical protein CSB69_0946 [Morganella morganii]|nr:hypothetical protein CSB69_0946 [Morganella morganii]